MKFIILIFVFFILTDVGRGASEISNSPCELELHSTVAIDPESRLISLTMNEMVISDRQKTFLPEHFRFLMKVPDQIPDYLVELINLVKKHLSDANSFPLILSVGSQLGPKNESEAVEAMKWLNSNVAISILYFSEGVNCSINAGLNQKMSLFEYIEKLGPLIYSSSREQDKKTLFSPECISIRTPIGRTKIMNIEVELSSSTLKQRKTLDAKSLFVRII